MIQSNVRQVARYQTPFAFWLAALSIVTLGVATSALAQSAPYAHTQAAGPITTTNATLNGMVVPNGANTVAWFEWGTNSSYGQTTVPVSVGNGTAVVRVSADVNNLAPQNNFWCRLVASNAVGAACGAPVLFATGQRVSAWGDNNYGQLNVPMGLSNSVAVAGGAGFSLALKSDGSVVSWGTNYYGQNYGQTDAPVVLSDVVSVTAGVGHSLALKSDGTVTAWGATNYNQTMVPEDLSNVVAVQGGGYHSLALKSDGKVVAWGWNESGQANVPTNLSNVVAVAGGGRHSLVLKSDGTVAAWGWNQRGQTNIPAGLSNVVAVAGGDEHNLALQSDGTVVGWGWNSFGQINVPVNLSNVVAIAAGYDHSMALKSDGKVVVWGSNSSGERDVPFGLSKVANVSAGSFGCLALGNVSPQALSQTNSAVAPADLTITLRSSDYNGDPLIYRVVELPALGTLYQWTPSGRGDPFTAPNTSVTDAGCRIILATTSTGAESFMFVVNDGLAESSPATVEVTFVPAWAFTQSVHPARSTTATLCGMVVAGSGTKFWFEWGLAGEYEQTTDPMDVGAVGVLTRVTNSLTNLTLGANYQCRVVASNSLGAVYGSPALFTTGQKISAWGRNIDGLTNMPTGLSNVVAVAGGYRHCMALKSDGTVVAWGHSPNGQANVPSALTNVVAIDAGTAYSLALRIDGTVVSWGTNAAGQLNVPPPAGLSNVVDVKAGGAHALALKSDGTVVAWGANSWGQTNVPAGLSNVAAIAAGESHSIAVQCDGTSVAWGLNQFGETSVPSGLSNVVAVAAGVKRSLAVKSDGTVLPWGLAYDPPQSSNFVSIAQGDNHCLAVDANGMVVAWGNNDYGQTNVPIALSNVVAVAGTAWSSLAIGGNLPPQSFSQIKFTVAQADLTLNLSGSDPNSDSLNYRVTTLPSVGTLYQWTPLGRGNLITAANTAVEDAGDRVIYTSPLLGNDSFTFVANDGQSDSPTASVSIRTVPSFTFTQPAQPSGSLEATLCGVVAAGVDTKVWFEWGAIGDFSASTPEAEVPPNGLMTRVTVSVTNLTEQTSYQCRLVASNALGVVYGARILFTTGQRVSAWGSNASGQTNVTSSASNVVVVVGGGSHNLALRADGTVAAWGLNSSGQVTVPTGLSKVVAVAAGGNHSMALKSDGSVVAWGSNNAGQTNLPAGLNNVVAVACGTNHCLAVKADGTVVAWGDNSSGQTEIPAGLGSVVAVSAGSKHSLALNLDGSVVAWGSSSFGQSSITTGLSNAVAVAAGGDHSLALTKDGKVIAWGLNSFGQTNVPASSTNVLAVAAGGSHSIALRENGTLVAWGANTSGQRLVPTTLSNLVAVGAGASHSLALGGDLPPEAQGQTNTGVALADITINLRGSDPNGDFLNYRVATLPAMGTLYQWTPTGRGSVITTANTAVEDAGGRIIFTSPSAATTSFTFVANDGVADSTSASVSITTAPSWAFTQSTQPAGSTAATLCGTVMAGSGTKVWFEWGLAGGYGQRTEDVDAATNGLLTRVTSLLTNLLERTDYQCRVVASNSIGVVYGAPMLFTTGRKVAGWGFNFSGQMNVPSGLTNVVAVAGGGIHNLALKADGAVVAWGNNFYGQTNVPAGLTSAVAVAGGDYHSLVLKSDGTVVAWGENSYGLTNVPSGLSNVVAVGGGGTHCLALKPDGTIVAWGDNGYGQTNVPSGLANVVAVAAGGGGGYHSVALRLDGKVVAWGYNSNGQTNVPAGLSNVVTVAAGAYHSLALKADGKVVAWGNNSYGQTNVPAGLSNVVAIAGGGFFSAALNTDGKVVVWGRSDYGQTNIPVGLSNVVAVAGGGYHSLALGGNLTPQARGQTNYAVALLDLNILMTGADPNGDSLSYRIGALPATGTLYHWTPGGRGSPITAPSTAVDDSGGRVIFALPTAGNDSFTFTVNDGEADSAPATVTVNFILAPVIDVSSLSMGVNGEFSLSFTGDTNASYRVWASTNLTTWTVLGPATQSPPGEFHFTDTAATNWPLRFYRVTCP
jgi:alpha-tubulin suppressor-like RCC1 family protein